MDVARWMGRILTGAAKFPPAFRRRHAEYLLRVQSTQGGFAGRAGKSDPYYTAFGLAGLVLVGELSESVADQVRKAFASDIESFTEEKYASVPLAEWVGLVACELILQGLFGKSLLAPHGLDVPEIVREYLGLVRRSDGGYAKHPQSPTSSTYATFLVGLVHQWVGLPLVDPEKTSQMLLGRQRDDGGFAEWDAIPHSGVNPTAAAVGWLVLAGHLSPSIRDRSAAFLASMQTSEGGFQAHARIPMADLLSTFTALVALEVLEASEAVDRKAAESYIARLELADGGFRAAAWDTSADVEYTFYGLAGLALLAEPDATP